MSAEHNHDSELDYRVPADSAWAGLWKVPAIVALAGLFGIFLSIFISGDMHRFGYAYLFAFFTSLTLVLGAMFLVLIQFLAVGHWGITCRRVVETVMVQAPLMAILAVPFIAMVATGHFTLYDEWIGASAHGDDHGEVHAPAGDKGDEDADDHGDGEAHAHTPQETALHHATLAKKIPYLNKMGWIVRAVGYLVVWCLIALVYWRMSRRQDETKDIALTRKMQSLSPISLMALGVTLTFASFDWLMSLEPAWYSTIFGVVIFASSAVAILALTILISLSLFNNGLVGNAINHEHFHDLGKLMFGFICFWAYVQFSQWMLIWYAGIPEEATWFHKRWQGGWKAVSLLLMFGHFLTPFVLLISRVQKRNLRWLQAMCVWILIMHVTDMYWFVMPQATEVPHLAPHLIDFACLLFIGGTLIAFVLHRLTKVPLIPIGDPRLARSLHHHQSH